MTTVISIIALPNEDHSEALVAGAAREVLVRPLHTSDAHCKRRCTSQGFLRNRKLCSIVEMSDSMNIELVLAQTKVYPNVLPDESAPAVIAVPSRVKTHLRQFHLFH